MLSILAKELFRVMGDQVRENQLTKLHQSDYYSLMIEESTDISVIKELVIYARYLSASAEVKNTFLSIVELPNDTTDVIERSLVSFLDKSSILLSRLVGFASDGVNVMTGCHNGVDARLTRRQPSLIYQYTLCCTSVSTSCIPSR